MQQHDCHARVRVSIIIVHLLENDASIFSVTIVWNAGKCNNALHNLMYLRINEKITFSKKCIVVHCAF